MKGAVDAADLLLDAIEAGKQITIYSDFDVDGLTSAAQLYLYLRALGATVNHYTPNRFTEGYGLTRSAIEKLAKASTEVLVTVDCGATSIEEVALAKRLGMQVLIVDHHQMPIPPAADCIINPAQPDCGFHPFELCAAGLVWLLLIVLRGRTKGRSLKHAAPDPKDFLDLAAIGTICDMVPLATLNRVIASRGIDLFRLTKRPGLVALKAVAGVQSTTHLGAGSIGFAIGPRINAAGRLDDAKCVFELLTTGDANVADTLAKKLDRLNRDRKDIEDEVKIACLEQIRTTPSLLEGNAFALFRPEFHAGVIGIVAQRLVEQFHKPAAVMAGGEIEKAGKMEQVAKGSVRGIRGFHVAEALQALDSLLVKHGGHAQAGGFTVSLENLQRFQAEFIELANRVLTPEMLERERQADALVGFSEVDFALVDELRKLAPFGMGNPSPLLVTRDVVVDSVQSVAGEHLRLRLSDSGHTCVGMAWRMQGHPALRKGNQISIAYQPEINTYQGVSSVQLNIQEVW